jgi:DUF1365 family protein
MGKVQLHVEIENGHIGKFIDWRNAELISPPVKPVAHSTAYRMSSPSVNVGENDDIEQLTNLLDHLVFTTATLISSNHGDPGQMTRLLDSSDQSV